ncbi:SIR2 family protein [Aeromonas veronii]
MNLHNSDELITALSYDIRRGRSITFLLGSAISFDKNGVGVPSVKGVINIIKDFVKEVGLKEQYESKLEGCSGNKEYQESFEFLFTICGAEDVKEVMKRVMDKAKDENGSWLITPTIISLAKIAKFARIKSIFTTNFDPLIEESFNESELDFISIFATNDSHIDNLTHYSSDKTNIVHLHGFWDGDTMHTPNQLNSQRSKLKSSLKNFFSNTSLYVIGYGGWDDIVNQTLIEIVNEKSYSVNIKWCFYEKDREIIINQNKGLFDSLNPLISQGRFTAFYGIDCESTFSDVYESIADSQIELKSKAIKIIPLNEVFTKTKTKRNPTKIKLFNNPLDNSHINIRVKKQSFALESLNAMGSFSLICKWGHGKLGFISSFLFDAFEHSLVRVDLSEERTKDDIERKFKSDVGTDFVYLVAAKLSTRVVIMFDNIDSLDNSGYVYLKEIISICHENPHLVNSIFISHEHIKLEINEIYLDYLTPNEVYNYINSGSQPVSINGEQLERLRHLTSGLPIKLDMIKSFMRVASLDEILYDETKELNITFENTIDDVPRIYTDLINELEESENSTKQRQYQLLKILSVIEYGEETKSIRRTFPQYKFEINDFVQLSEKDLIYPIHIDDVTRIIINKINPLIREFVLSKLPSQELVSIRKQAVSLILGDTWHNGKVHVKLPAISLLNNIEFHPGNTHAMLVNLLSECFDDTEEFNVTIKAAVSYCMTLNRECRFKELVYFSRSIHELISHFKHHSADSNKIEYYLSEGCRMLSKHDDAISIIENYLSRTTSSTPHYNKTTHYDMLSTLALIQSNNNDVRVYSLAREIKKGSAKNSSRRLLADSILAERLPRDVQIEKLKRIEKVARGHGHVILANNITLTLSSLEPVKEDEYLTKVIETEKSTYTLVRAMLRRLKIFLNKSPDALLSEKDLGKLIDAYNYLFSQRIDGLFNDCHDLIWKVLTNRGNIDDILSFFDRSSLVWRVNGDQDRELEYLSKIKEIIDNDSIPYNKAQTGYIYKRLEFFNK